MIELKWVEFLAVEIAPFPSPSFPHAFSGNLGEIVQMDPDKNVRE
jgi:hypothetical protein